MTDPSSTLLEKLYAASMEPDHFLDLLQEWDQQIDHSQHNLEAALGLLGNDSLRSHLHRAAQIIERFEDDNQSKFDQLLAEFRTAAMVITPPNLVVAANVAANAIFNVKAQQPLQNWSGNDHAHASLLEAISTMMGEAKPQERIIRFSPSGSERLVMMHLRPVLGGDHGSRLRHVLVITSEYIWSEAMTETLQSTFGVTTAEIKILRQLAGGDRVASIAAETGRSEGTVRSQLNALMQKTGIRSQNDLLRLASLLLHSTGSLELLANAPDSHQHSLPSVIGENVFQHISLRDGRKLDYFSIGDPHGRPFLWLMSDIGQARWHRDAERTLGEKGLHMIVPVRAGFGYSSQPPPDRQILDVAVDDTFQLMDKLGIARCPVIAPCDDICIALMMAKKKTGRISHIFAGGTGFPIATPAQYHRLHAMSRFFRANARYAPASLPFVIKTVRALIRRQGVPAYIRKALSHFPVDQKVFADPGVLDAIVAGFQLMVGPDTHCERVLAAEIVSMHRPWPTGLGDVDCPVTLFHGAHDGNAPIETAREYASLYPNWELLTYEEEGQFVLYSKWQEVLARLEEAV